MFLPELTKYYKDNGILSTHFNCPYKKICKGDNKKFYGPKSSYVSIGYEKEELPKLLFLSLDPGVSKKDYIKRLPKSVREIEENRNVNELPKNRHWYKTHELAYYILSQFKDDLTIENAKYYFAHVNSVKCSANNPNHKQARKILFNNCRNYILDELLLLDPDIIITQGLQAKKSIEKLVLKKPINPNQYYYIIELNEKKVFWLHTYHPSNYGAFNKQYRKGKGFERYSKIIYKWYCNNKKA
ncbi:MAG TPA: hypothetical protein ENI76_01825 [Ignavibacteria bacterium]|nr:hypothetical protein [Ignavibacteria bacterium]